MALEYPEFLSVGGNTGKVDSFTGLDLNDVTGGLVNAGTLTQGNNLLCFGFQAVVQMLPDLLEGLFTDVTPAQSLLGSALNKATNSLGCPKLNNINNDQYDQFPGYAKS